MFAEARAQGRTNEQAARLAGYSPNTASEQAHRIANSPHVAAEINHRLELRTELTEMSVEWWRNRTIRYLREAENANDLANVGRALELAGRHLGALDPQTQNQSAAAQILAALFAQTLQQRALPSQQPADVTASVTMSDSST